MAGPSTVAAGLFTAVVGRAKMNSKLRFEVYLFLEADLNEFH